MRQWGEHVERLEAIAATGQRVKTLEDRPKLTDILSFFYRAYVDLQAEANHNGTITWRSVSDYCDDLEIYDKEMLFDVLRQAQAKVNKWSTALASQS